MKKVTTKIPGVIKLVIDKYCKNQPHQRKVVEFACIISATTKEKAAEELESLADIVRQSGIDYVANGCGYYQSSIYAVTKREK